MSCHAVIAVVGLSALHACGLEAILSRRHGPGVVRLQEAAALDSWPGRIDGYVVGATQFLGRLDYFLPRKDRVVVLTSTPDVLKASGVACIGLDDTEDEIAATLMRVGHHADEQKPDVPPLSQRELDVLRLFARGQTLKEISDKLCISVNTAATHRKNISAKLGISSRSELSLYAMMNGLL